MTSCLNCGHSFKGNFCPNCGQKATIKRITFAGLIEDALHFFTHIEKGFLYTTWNFLIRPGITSLNYLRGRRKKYQSAVSYFLIWTGLYILVHNGIINHNHYKAQAENISQLNLVEQGNVLLRSHFTFFVLPVMLASAFFIFLVLARPRFNFMEVFTLSLYGGGTYFMMLMISDIILGMLFKINTITTGVFLYQTVLSSVYNFWICFDIFKRLHLRLFWLRLIASAMLVAMIGYLLLTYLPVAWIRFGV